MQQQIENQPLSGQASTEQLAKIDKLKKEQEKMMRVMAIEEAEAKKLEDRAR